MEVLKVVNVGIGPTFTNHLMNDHILAHQSQASSSHSQGKRKRENDESSPSQPPHASSSHTQDKRKRENDDSEEQVEDGLKRDATIDDMYEKDN